ncbi:MAG TPA: glucose-6-phosphate dehydrogenase [bacterium]
MVEGLAGPERMGAVKTEPATLVVLGATGDLAQRKLYPALQRLMAREAIDARTRILGAGRRADVDDRGFRAMARRALPAASGGDEPLDRWCDTCLSYQSIAGGGAEDYQALARRIESLERDGRLPANRVFYLALPPDAFPGTIAGLGEAGLNRSGGWTRLVVEKPFGRDLPSAQDLNRLAHRYFDESQIYRIDHYLGKETVQNLLIFRFSNPIFETLWNRDRVEHVQITVAEDVGLEGRVAYYTRAGALRDMVQNHLAQLLSLVAMEIPGAFDADAIRNEKVKVLRGIVPLGEDDAVFGQYRRGRLNGREVPGYLEEPGVAPDSTTETFAALRLDIATWRWHGVPFYLRTGKRLPHRTTRIVITFRRPPVLVFQPAPSSCVIHANQLVITIQPDEGFELSFEVKAPGQPLRLETQRLHFRYAEAFAPLPDGYETLLLDVLAGDQTLFVRADEVEASWRVFAPVLERRPPIRPYDAGTWGPESADALLAGEGHRWVPV